MSNPKSSSSSDDLSDFSSAGGESTGRVVRGEQDLESKSSSATLSCMKDSNDAVTTTVAERVRMISPKKTLRRGYNWLILRSETSSLGIALLMSFRILFLVLRFIILILRMI